MASRTQDGPLVVDTATGELVPYQPAALTLFGTDDPNEVVKQSARHAKALANVIDERKLYTSIQGKRHVHVDGWQLLGSMVGVFAVEEGPAEPVEIGGIHGFRATVTARTRTGEIVGRATAYCMRDEDRWRAAKVHALASMAQTRAQSKALKGTLGFIVKLAGFEPTPAEEMSDVQDGTSDSFNGGGGPLPEERRKKMERKVYALMGKLDKADVGMDRDTIKRQYSEWYGTEKITELDDKDLGELIDRLVAAEERLA